MEDLFELDENRQVIWILRRIPKETKISLQTLSITGKARISWTDKELSLPAMRKCYLKENRTMSEDEATAICMKDPIVHQRSVDDLHDTVSEKKEIIFLSPNSIDLESLHHPVQLRRSPRSGRPLRSPLPRPRLWLHRAG